MLFIGAVGQVHSSSMCFIALLTCSDETEWYFISYIIQVLYKVHFFLQLPWKSLKSIVEYYYMWKTTDRYVQQKRIKAAEAESKLKQVYIPN